MSPRSKKLALALALLAALGVAGASGYASWRRAHRPWRELRLPSAVRWLSFGRDATTLAVQQIVPDRDQGSRAIYHVLALATESEVRVVEDEPGLRLTRHGLVLHLPEGEPASMEDLASGARRAILEAGVVTSTSRVSLAPDLRTVAFVTSENALELRSVLGAAPRSLALADSKIEARYAWILFSPGGERVAASVASFGGDFVHVWSTGTGAREQDTDLSVVGFARSGELVTAGDSWTPGSPVEIALAPAQGPPRVLARVVLEEARQTVCVSGDRLASVEREVSASEDAPPAPVEVVVRALPSGAVVRRLPLPPGEKVQNLALSHDGDRLALGFASGLVEVWDLPP